LVGLLNGNCNDLKVELIKKYNKGEKKILNWTYLDANNKD